MPQNWSRDKIIDNFNEKNIPCYSGSCSEVYLEKAFEGQSYKPKEPLKNARQLGETSLMFLVHPTLSENEVELTCQAINEIFTKVADS